MCGFMKAPKPAPVAPPAPPAPPAPEPPTAPVFNAETRRRDAEVSGADERRRGRQALRIDLQAPPVAGEGLRLPTK